MMMVLGMTMHAANKGPPTDFYRKRVISMPIPSAPSSSASLEKKADTAEHMEGPSYLSTTHPWTHEAGMPRRQQQQPPSPQPRQQSPVQSLEKPALLAQFNPFLAERQEAKGQVQTATGPEVWEDENTFAQARKMAGDVGPFRNNGKGMSVKRFVSCLNSAQPGLMIPLGALVNTVP